MTGLDEDLIGAIYEPGLIEGNWRPALERLRVLLNSAETALVEYETAASAVTAVNILTDASYHAYGRQFLAFDPKAPIFARGGPGFVFNDAEHFDDAFVARDPFYQGFSVPHGMRHTLDLFACRDGTREVYLAGMRPKRQGPFVPADCVILKKAGTQFLRARKLRGWMRETQDLARHASGALDRLGYGIVVLDERLRVALANALAREVLAGAGELGIRQSRLVARSGALARSLDKALAAAVGGAGPATALRVTRTRGGQLVLWCVALPASSPLADGERPGVLVILRDAQACATLSPEDLQALYGLTRAEAHLALALSQGETLAVIAAKRGVKISTVRTQLLAVLAKMGLHRQSDITRTLASLAAPVRALR